MREQIQSSNTLVILDNGHGSDTPGKRSPIWEDGKQLFEWAYNRVLVKYISDYMKVLGISYVILVTENEDISLAERVKRANDIYLKYKDKFKLIYLVSVHGNAFSDPKTKGIEVFTSIGQTKSDVIAEYFLKELKNVGWKMRHDLSDGDLDKEEHFYILKNTTMPAILTENGFYTNEEECRKMLEFNWNMEIAKAHYRAIYEIEKLYIRGGKL